MPFKSAAQRRMAYAVAGGAKAKKGSMTKSAAKKMVRHERKKRS